MTTDYEKNVSIVKNLFSAINSKDVPTIMGWIWNSRKALRNMVKP